MILLREDTNPNYVVIVVDSDLRSTRTGLRWKREELASCQERMTRLVDEIAELEAREAQLASFLDFRTGQ
jgi:hypothetical protein